MTHVHLELKATQTVQLVEVCTPLVCIRQLPYKILQIGIPSNHEGRDIDLLPAAHHSRIKDSVDDLPVQAKTVFIEPAILEHAGGLPVCDHENLAVGVPLLQKRMTRHLKGVQRVGMKRSHLKIGQIFYLDLPRLISKCDDIE